MNTINYIYKILNESFQDKSEIYKGNYFIHCRCFYINKNNEIYELTQDSNIDGEICSLMFVKNNIEITGCYEIVIFCTNIKYMNLGYGYKLLSFIKNYYLKENKKLQLHVRVSNVNAIKLYEKVGFKRRERISNFYHYTNNNEDGYYYN
jgi:hypothetical protein